MKQKFLNIGHLRAAIKHKDIIFNIEYNNGETATALFDDNNRLINLNSGKEIRKYSDINFFWVE